MIFIKLEDNLYQLKILNINNIDFNMDNYDKLKKYVLKVLKKNILKYNIFGLLKVDIYIYKFNILVNIYKISNNDFIDNLTNMKITFYINNNLLHKIDYFDFVENINYKSKTMYYYKSNFYIDVETLEEKDYMKIIEFLDNTISNDNFIKESMIIYI